MKKTLLLISLLLSFLINAQGVQIQIGNNKTSSVATGDPAGNPNVSTAYSITDITNAGIGAYIEIQDDLALSGNFTPPANQTWLFTTGSLDLSTFILTGDNTSVIFTNEEKGFNAFSGTFAGTWNIPDVIYSSQFGFKNDGYKYIGKGSITAASTTLTVTGGNFNQTNISNFIAVHKAKSGYVLKSGSLDIPDYNSNSSLQTTIASVTNATTVELTTPADVTVSNVDVWTGSDNFNVGKQFIYMREQNPGTMVFNDNGTGMIFKSRIDQPINNAFATSRTTWAIGNGTDDIKIINKSRLCMIPHANYTSRFIEFFNTHRLSWEGGTIEGEFSMHNYSNTNPGLADEGGHGIEILTLAINGTLKNVNILNFMGDGITGNGDLQFTNYIKGSAVSGYPGVAEFVSGGIDDSGVNEVNADKLRTDNFIDITGFQFENTRLLHPTREGKKRYQFSGSSFAGWSGLKNMRYTAYHYDSTDTFLFKRDNLEFYQPYEVPDDVAKLKIVIDSTIDATLIDAQVRAPLMPRNWTFENVNIYDCARHGASNLPDNMFWYNSEIARIGPTLPARAINDEDFRESVSNRHYENLVIRDVYGGGINLIGVRNSTLVNIHFEGSNYYGLRETATFGRAIETYRGRGVNMIGGIIKNGSVQLGRGSSWVGGMMYGGTIQAEANAVVIKDFRGVNAYLIDAVFDPSLDREKNYLEDSKFFFDKNVTSLIADRNRIWEMKNVEFNMNHKTQLNFQIGKDDVYEEVVISSGIDTGIWTTTVPTNDFASPIYDLKITGARTDISIRDYTSGVVTLVDMEKAAFDCSVTFRGTEQDYRLKDIKINGWLEFGLNSWSGTLSSPSLITLDGFEVIVNGSDFNWTNTGSNVFTTPAKNMSFHLKNGLFELNAAATVIGSSNKFIDLNQLGTGLFETVVFRSTVNTSIPFDLTNTNIFPANLGNITFLNCEFDGVIPTLRSGDKMLYTYPSPNAPTYADNATALAALGEGYYYKLTGTGEYKITF